MCVWSGVGEGLWVETLGILLSHIFLELFAP